MKPSGRHNQNFIILGELLGKTLKNSDRWLLWGWLLWGDELCSESSHPTTVPVLEMRPLLQMQVQHRTSDSIYSSELLYL